MAEATTASGVILCGGSETPTSSRIHKAAVGTEEWVPWRYFSSAKEALLELKSQHSELQIIAVEQDKAAVDLDKLNGLIDLGRPVAIVVGHETEGVSREVLDMADMIVEIPMWGVNKSLNVIVSTAIVAYQVLHGGKGSVNRFSLW